MFFSLSDEGNSHLVCLKGSLAVGAGGFGER